MSGDQQALFLSEREIREAAEVEAFDAKFLHFSGQYECPACRQLEPTRHALERNHGYRSADHDPAYSLPNACSRLWLMWNHWGAHSRGRMFDPEHKQHIWEVFADLGRLDDLEDAE